jgi:alpha-glucosidase
MTDVAIPRDCVQDPWELREPGLGLGRDPERTPMQWDSESAAGFTSARPWLPLSLNYPVRNVAASKADRRSLLNLYRDLIVLRRQWSALSVGGFKFLEQPPNLLAYERFDQTARIQIFLNLSADEISTPLEKAARLGRILFSTSGEGDVDLGTKMREGQLALHAHEGVLILIARD